MDLEDIVSSAKPRQSLRPMSTGTRRFGSFACPQRNWKTLWSMTARVKCWEICGKVLVNDLGLMAE